MTQGSQTFEMLWDCRMCGTKKLLGKRNRFCPNCGAAQDPEWRYFPSDADMVFIENPVSVGADKVCPACGTANAGDAKFCVQCGADMLSAKEAAGIANIDTGFEGASGASRDVVKEKWDTEQAAIKASAPVKKGFLGLPKWVLGLLVVLVIGGGIFAFLSASRDKADIKVSDLDWTRTIKTEQYAPYSTGAWISGVPGDAYDRSCGQQIKGYNKVPDGTERVCHTRSVSVACGYTYKDNKDGSGSRVTKYCNESRQECGMETKYRSVPYYDTYCSYKVNRWGPSDPIVASGGPDDIPDWPTFVANSGNSVGSKREAGREEKYVVTFTQAGKTSPLTYDPKTLDQYSLFKIGQSYIVEINKLGNVFWDTLKRNAQ